MRVCVVGPGGREHALVEVLSRSAEVVATPGNAGMAGTAYANPVRTTTAPPEELEADLYVIGPEVPLVGGLADRLRARGRLVLGPGADGARLEGSKAYMKRLAEAAGVPTARFGVFSDAPSAEAFLASLAGRYVVKTDGLAAGKGVLVTDDLAEARADVADKLSGRAFGAAGRTVVIEEALEGEEVSLLALCDGQRAVALPLARDHKRLGDGDAGPNTGGMGAFSPVPGTAGAPEAILERIVEPTLAALRRAGVDYRGVLYAGCMLTADGPRLIEFNVRLGDPEAQVVLPRLCGDVAGLFAEAAAGRLTSTPEVSDLEAVCVVMAAGGYPASPRTGGFIRGLERAGTVEGVRIYHAGTAVDDAGRLVVAGGRVLGVTALAPDLQAARRRAYEACAEIEFEGAQYRRDIAASALAATEANP